MTLDLLGWRAKSSSGLVTSDNDREARWAAEIKYYSARDVYHKRERRTPISKKSWQQWWEDKYGEPYMEYVHRMSERKKRGESPI